MKTITLTATLLIVSSLAFAAPWTEDFESGFTGAPVGTHADWGPTGAGPTATTGSGVAGSVGLPPDGEVFNWTIHEFDRNDPGFPGQVILGMDYSTTSGGVFDDDRLVLITSNTTSSSANFGVQLDNTDGGIVTYWRDSSGNRIQDPIVPLASLNLEGDTWYRFTCGFTFTGATDAQLDVALVKLDASGDPTGTPVTGQVPSVAAWPGGAPADSYFTSATLIPAYKNYNNGLADNAYFEVVPEPATMSLLALGGLALLKRKRKS